MRTRVVTAVIVALAALSLAACGGGNTPQQLRGVDGAMLPQAFPRDLIPPGSYLLSSGEVVQLSVTQSVEDLFDFYEDALPATGWSVMDDWDGVDPAGNATSGLIVQNGDESGAVAFTEQEEGERVLVRINLAQPYHNPQGGMGVPGGGGGAHEGHGQSSDGGDGADAGSGTGGDAEG